MLRAKPGQLFAIGESVRSALLEWCAAHVPAPAVDAWDREAAAVQAALAATAAMSPDEAWPIIGTPLHTRAVLALIAPSAKAGGGERKGGEEGGGTPKVGADGRVGGMFAREQATAVACMVRAITALPSPAGPVQRPPDAIMAVVDTIFHQHCGGDTLLLRCMLAMVEETEYRLRLVTMGEALAKADVRSFQLWTAHYDTVPLDNDDLDRLAVAGSLWEEPSGDRVVAASPTAVSGGGVATLTATRPASPRTTSPRPASSTSRSPVHGPTTAPASPPASRLPPSSLPREGASLRLHQLSEEQADALARAVRAKREIASVPILPGGGGANAKLLPQHMLVVHQLVILLRQAVLAFPPTPYLAMSVHHCDLIPHAQCTPASFEVATAMALGGLTNHGVPSEGADAVLMGDGDSWVPNAMAPHEWGTLRRVEPDVLENVPLVDGSLLHIGIPPGGRPSVQGWAWTSRHDDTAWNEALDKLADELALLAALPAAVERDDMEVIVPRYGSKPPIHITLPAQSSMRVGVAISASAAASPSPRRPPSALAPAVTADPSFTAIAHTATWAPRMPVTLSVPASIASVAPASSRPAGQALWR